MLAVAPATIKEAAQAVEDYVAIKIDQPPRAMPVESRETTVWLLVWEAGWLAVMDAITKKLALQQHLLTQINAKPAKQMQGCFKCRGSHLQKNC